MDKAEMQELDAWLAENVMGWTPPGHPRTEAARIREHLTHSTYDLYWFDSGKWELRKIDSWYPTTNITQAWQVLETITEPPKTVEMAKRMVNTRFAAWFDKARLWAMTAQEAALEISVNAKKAWEAK